MNTVIFNFAITQIISSKELVMNNISLTDKNFYILGCNIIFKYINALDAETNGVISGCDIESIHKLRVAARRLKESLKVFKELFNQKRYGYFKKQIKELISTLSIARDADVQINLLEKVCSNIKKDPLAAAIEQILNELKNFRKKIEPRIRRIVQSFTKRKILESIKKELMQYLNKYKNNTLDLNSKYLYQKSFETISLNIKKIFCFEKYLNNKNKKNEHHKMRIAFKHLRYSMEIFELLNKRKFREKISIIQKFQELLGDIHDCDVWEKYLDEYNKTILIGRYNNKFSELKKAIDYLKKNIKLKRDKLFTKLKEFWQLQKEEKLWENIENIMRAVIK